MTSPTGSSSATPRSIAARPSASQNVPSTSDLVDDRGEPFTVRADALHRGDQRVGRLQQKVAGDGHAGLNATRCRRVRAPTWPASWPRRAWPAPLARRGHRRQDRRVDAIHSSELRTDDVGRRFGIAQQHGGARVDQHLGVVALVVVERERIRHEDRRQPARRQLGDGARAGARTRRRRPPRRPWSSGRGSHGPHDVAAVDRMLRHDRVEVPRPVLTTTRMSSRRAHRARGPTAKRVQRRRALASRR